MKILYSCLSKSWGGLEMSLIWGAEKLLQNNIDIDVLCYPGSQINLEAQKLGINCITLKTSGYFNPLQLIKLAGILKDNTYHIIHTQLSKDLWTIVPALNYLKSNIPLLLTKQMESAVIKKDFFHKRLYEKVNYVLAISNTIKENVLYTCPVPEEKVILHYTGTDLKKYNPSNADRNKIRTEFRIKDTELVIGMLARISYGKGYEELLRAARILIDEFSNLKFLLVGDSSPDEREYCEKIKKLAEDLSITGKVIFTGFRKDTADILSAMDIFAFPSYAESFGYSLVEAMAVEKPCVGTNSHGVLDIIQDGVTGYLFNKKDENDLASKIKLLINSPEKRIKMGKAARQRVIERFDSEKQTEKLIELYNKVVL